MAMENVSNCQLLLNVEVRKIAGTLALNIPPHPVILIYFYYSKLNESKSKIESKLKIPRENP